MDEVGRFYIRHAADLNLAGEQATLPHLIYEQAGAGPTFVCACSSEAQARRVVDALTMQHFTEEQRAQWHARM